MKRNDRAPVTLGTPLLKGNVTAFLAKQHEAGAAESADEFTAGDGRKMPTHAATSMLVR